jgi:hypothetical protein
MSKCEFVYEVHDPSGRFFPPDGTPATLRCKTHDCTMITQTESDGMVCYIGRIEALEERMGKLREYLERPQSSTHDELGNPFSLRIPVKDE